MSLADVLSAAAVATGSALITVIDATGSVPRRPPAKMLVGTDGSQVGTVGGGRLEAAAIEAAAAVASGRTGASRLRLRLAVDLGMCCGGEVELWLEPLGDECRAVLAEVARRRAGRKRSALATWLDGRGKEILCDDASLATRRPRLEENRFVEPVLPPERLLLFGGGHVARAVAALAATVGFEVTVCEEDGGLAAADRFPDARVLPTYDADEVARALAPLGRGDFAVVLSRDHALDQAILEKLLPRAYLGMIGSQGKVDRFRKRLEARGPVDPELWNRLHAPVGVAIGADTPEEIAVAIVAELIATRAGNP